MTLLLEYKIIRSICGRLEDPPRRADGSYKLERGRSKQDKRQRRDRRLCARRQASAHTFTLGTYGGGRGGAPGAAAPGPPPFAAGAPGTLPLPPPPPPPPFAAPPFAAAPVPVPSPVLTTCSTTVLKLVQWGHCTPRKCQLRWLLRVSQSLHMMLTTRARSEGMGCISMSRARVAHAAAMDCWLTTVFLQMGQR
jgi:hypothetical protein